MRNLSTCEMRTINLWNKPSPYNKKTAEYLFDIMRQSYARPNLHENKAAQGKKHIYISQGAKSFTFTANSIRQTKLHEVPQNETHS